LSTERDRRHLAYILDSISLISGWARAGQDEFLSNDLIRNATLYRLETLAHSASKLSSGVKARHPDVAWRDITDFRNRLAHAYLELDLDLIWRVIELDLPVLRRAVEAELG
jgi:uncharacterized protein with HEPN domain